MAAFGRGTGAVLGRLRAGLVLGMVLLLAGCATERVPPLARQAGFASISVASGNASIVLRRLEPFVRAALQDELGPPARGGGRLAVVLSEASFPSYAELEERTDLYGDVLWGSVTVRSPSGAVLASVPQLQGQTIRIVLDRSYGVPSDERLAALARAFARSVAVTVSRAG